MIVTSLLLLAPLVAASPAPAVATSIPLIRRNNAIRNGSRTLWLKAQAETLLAKYGASSSSSSKRANTATISLTDQGQDVTYYASVSVGTPAQNFDVVLDTGSSDLWIASSSCQTGCSGINTFDSSKSTSFKDQSRQITISYGSGDVAGTVGTDTVSFGGFTVQNQGLGVMTQITAQLLSGSLSGIMGLGWASLASSGATPWWETLAKGGSWAQPLFGFYLARNEDSLTATSPGGSLDLGFVNSSFTNINYVSLTSQDYWNIPVQSITVGGKVITSGAGGAMDTGTTLIAAPSAFVKEFYSNVMGAVAATGDLSGYYEYACSSVAEVSITLGGKTYAISSTDFSLQLDSAGQQCVGGKHDED
ncbi:acid protease [Clavulina sp. PMI_390]|nr:acid protease [Clavulina sp. PMI_390]